MRISLISIVASSPFKISEIEFLSASELIIDGDYLYVMGIDGLSIIDVTDPLNPEIRGFLEMEFNYGIQKM